MYFRPMNQEGYLLGIDIGSSSVKASLIDVGSGQSVASAQSPSEEMSMLALQPGWAEQDPEMWWEHAVNSVKACLKKSGIMPEAVLGIGIAYQMHGLVVVDKDQKALRPSIIWCDSRAVKIGDQAFHDLGSDYCLKHFLNSPGNFTASKLKWIKTNEPDIYRKIFKIMLPGDFIAMKMTGEVTTTTTGLSEGMFWDYQDKAVSKKLLDYYGINESLLANIVPVFSIHGELRKSAAVELGLASGTKIAYRAGDQPNNAFSLNVLDPGETAATAGTSGVIYSVTDKNAFDGKSRVNGFIHVNSSDAEVRNGVLLCVNGTGIQNSWLRKNIKSNGDPFGYDAINKLAAGVPIGSEGVRVLPFGNGSERIFENRDTRASIQGLNFNTHSQAHVFRAAQEGIVFALNYGFDILQHMGVKTTVIKAGKANMFLSPVFRDAFVNTIGARLELYDTDGAKGAALGAGIGTGVYRSFKEAFSGLHMIDSQEPERSKQEEYVEVYGEWKKALTVNF
jgi:xylulokinase